MYETLAILAVFVFFYSTVGGSLERTPINGALVFTAFGLVFGPLGLDLLDMDVDAEGLRTLAELTLAMVLFTDASNSDLGVLKKNIRIPGRLLLVGLPLTIVFGFGVGVVLFDGLTLFEIAILATMLAPTDAALGKAVVSDERVPANIRQGLNVESGLNAADPAADDHAAETAAAVLEAAAAPKKSVLVNRQAIIPLIIFSSCLTSRSIDSAFAPRQRCTGPTPP